MLQRQAQRDSRPAIALLAAVFLAVSAGLAVGACSNGSQSGASDTAPTPAPSVTAVPTPLPTSTPQPTPTPEPAAADLIATTAPQRGLVELEIVSADAATPLSFAGAYDVTADAVEVTFDLDTFLTLATLADPGLGADPLLGEARGLAGGQWRVRRVGAEVYVQQPFLVEAAGGEAGDWLAVDDPALSQALASGGLLGGGLQRQALHDLLRTGGHAAAIVDEQPTALTLELVVVGANVSVGGGDAASSGEFVGVAALHLVEVPAVVVVDPAGIVQSAVLSVPEDGFGEGSAAADLRLTYLDGPVPELTEPARWVTPAPAE